MKKDPKKVVILYSHQKPSDWSARLQRRRSVGRIPPATQYGCEKQPVYGCEKPPVYGLLIPAVDALSLSLCPATSSRGGAILEHTVKLLLPAVWSEKSHNEKITVNGSRLYFQQSRALWPHRGVLSHTEWACSENASVCFNFKVPPAVVSLNPLFP